MSFRTLEVLPLCIGTMTGVAVPYIGSSAHNAYVLLSLAVRLYRSLLPIIQTVLNSPLPIAHKCPRYPSSLICVTALRQNPSTHESPKRMANMNISGAKR